MRAFIEAHSQGRVVTLAQLAQALPIALDRIEDILDLFWRNGFVEKLPGLQSKYRLLKSADTLSIADLYRLFVLPGESLGGQHNSELAPLIAEIGNTLEAGMQRRLSDVFRPAEEQTPTMKV